MNLAEFLTPSGFEDITFLNPTLGKQLVFEWTPAALKEVGAIVLGVPEYRASGIVASQETEVIRKQLYQLYGRNFNKKILDLGDLKCGNALKDTYFALEEVLLEVMQFNIPVILLGGSSDLIVPILRAQEKFEQYYTAVAVDYKIDYAIEDGFLSNENYLQHFFTSSPNFLYQYLHTGIQAYHQHPEFQDFFKSVNYDAQRLGAVRGNIKDTEPMFRLANLAFFDFSALKYSEGGYGLKTNANGFYAEEFCQMAKYAGYSENIGVFGLFDFTIEGKTNTEKAAFASISSEAIWCFLEALPLRVNENPSEKSNLYTRYTVYIEDFQQEVSFVKSVKTNRWWIEAPRSHQDTRPVSALNFLPCNEGDYELAKKNIIPEAWWSSLYNSN